MKKTYIFILLFLTSLIFISCSSNKEDEKNTSKCAKGLVWSVERETCIDPSLVTCDENEELVDGDCLAKCADTEERVNGECLIKCNDDEERINGNCEKSEIECAEGEKIVNGICVKIQIIEAGQFQSRQLAEAEAKPYTATIKTISFPDPNLEKAVRDVLGFNEYKIMQPSDVDHLTTLNAANKNIIDLTGIKQLYALQKLNLQGNIISDITPLNEFVNHCFSNTDINCFENNDAYINLTSNPLDQESKNMCSTNIKVKIPNTTCPQ